MWFLDALALAWTKNPKFCVGGSLTMANTVYDHKLKENNKKIIYKKKIGEACFLVLQWENMDLQLGKTIKNLHFYQNNMPILVQNITKKSELPHLGDRFSNR